MKPTARRDEASGLIAGIAAFLTWGLVPVYWKLMARIPAPEILAHRFVWTAILVALLLTWQSRWQEVFSIVRSRRKLLFCSVSGLAISVNWLVFIWAVNAGHVLETSLGYFMTPLMNVLFGAAFLRERLTRLQLVSFLIAALAVAYLTFGFARFPWIALTLAISFGWYGFFRKISGTAPVPGLFFETILIMPIALAYLLFVGSQGTIHFGFDFPGLSLLLVSSGIVTGVPLLWFAHAAHHLRLSTVGFLQYLSPTCSFLLGVFVYHEAFQSARAITFALIWIALLIFTADLWVRRQQSRVSPVKASAHELIS